MFFYLLSHDGSQMYRCESRISVGDKVPTMQSTIVFCEVKKFPLKFVNDCLNSLFVISRKKVGQYYTCVIIELLMMTPFYV